MSRRFWLPIIAAVGLTLGAGVAAPIPTPRSPIGSEPQPPKQGVGQSAYGQKEQPTSNQMSRSAFPGGELPSLVGHTKDDQAEHSGRMDAPAWVEAISALFTAIFTGVLCMATYRLWNSTKGLYDETKRLAGLAEIQSRDMKDSIGVADKAANAAIAGSEIARRTMYETQRAFLFMVDIRPEYGANEVLAFHLIWRNSGATPAMNCDAWADNACTTFAAPPIFSTRERPEAKSTTNAGPNMTIETRTVVPLDDVRRTQRGECNLFIWSIAEYDDFLGTGKRHKTEVCIKVQVMQDIDEFLAKAKAGGSDKLGSPFGFNFVGPQNTAH